MPLIRQNFSLAQGDDAIITLDIDPDVESLVGSNLTFRVYDQQMVVPIGDALIVNNLDAGLEISDPDYGIIMITFEEADTSGLAPKNYVHEATIWDTDGKRTTVEFGIMTLARTENPTVAP